ncbi:MAG TPA: hypothetical protein VF587_06120, partial [Solirubrobacteraceae bacterium]
ERDERDAETTRLRSEIEALREQAATGERAQHEREALEERLREVTQIVAQGAQRSADLEGRLLGLREQLSRRVRAGDLSPVEGEVIARARLRASRGLAAADDVARRAEELRDRLLGERAGSR